MLTTEPLSRLIKITSIALTKKQSLLLEAEIFNHIYEELMEVFKKQYKYYFDLMKLTIETENIMIESKLVFLIIEDILATGEYNLSGIAHYTNTDEEIIEELLIKHDTNPSALFFRKLINLHRSVKRELYDEIIKKLSFQ
jgi:hypothetical protein